MAARTGEEQHIYDTIENHIKPLRDEIAKIIKQMDVDGKIVDNIIIHGKPNFEGLIDQAILDRFKNSSVIWGDIINAQLIEVNKELTKELKKLINKL